MKILWIGFWLEIVIILVHFVGALFHFNPVVQQSIQWLMIIVPILLFIIHICQTLSIGRGLIFMTLAGGVGWISEVIGLKWGVLFGGQYVYHMGGIEIVGVPWPVIAYWAIFSYTGYCVVTGLLFLFQKSKPAKGQSNLKLLPLLVVADGLVVMAIDLFMDPIQVNAGAWVWPNGGPYFGVPIGNFIGWFLVVILITGIFRSIEFFFPRPERENIQEFLSLSVLTYAVMGMAFVISALLAKMYLLTFVGSLVMFPTVVGYFFLRQKKELM